MACKGPRGRGCNLTNVDRHNVDEWGQHQGNDGKGVGHFREIQDGVIWMKELYGKNVMPTEGDMADWWYVPSSVFLLLWEPLVNQCAKSGKPMTRPLELAPMPTTPIGLIGSQHYISAAALLQISFGLKSEIQIMRKASGMYTAAKPSKSGALPTCYVMIRSRRKVTSITNLWRFKERTFHGLGMSRLWNSRSISFK